MNEGINSDVGYNQDLTAGSREIDKRGEFVDKEVEEYKNEIANTIYELKKYLEKLAENQYEDDESWNKFQNERERLRPMLTELVNQILLAETGEKGIGNETPIAADRILRKMQAADPEVSAEGR